VPAEDVIVLSCYRAIVLSCIGHRAFTCIFCGKSTAMLGRAWVLVGCFGRLHHVIM
jgi:hypothetical protein